MLVTSISAKNSGEALVQIRQALTYPIDAVELRLDYFDALVLEEIKKVKEGCRLPLIFTLRSKTQGGKFSGTEVVRLKLIEALCEIEPDYFDLESEVPRSFAQLLKKRHAQIRLICSYHDFKKTPEDLNQLLASMQDDSFSIYKIATFANSTIDSLRMLNFVREHNEKSHVCGLCMGSLGEPTRILAPIVNSALNFVCVDKNQATAPGQLALETLFNTYHYDKINLNTHIYALLGDPVEQSVGHVFHNEVFHRLKENAVYVKLQLKVEELSRFFNEISHFSFYGFSVTMPLKESIVAYLDELSEEVKKINASNTMSRMNNKFIGFNTDGVGALNAIEKTTLVKDKKIIVLGAGGTAKAIVSEAINRGATVIVLNRTQARANEIAQTFNCKAYSMDATEQLAIEGYDILINATSFGMGSQSHASLISAAAIIPETIVLEMVYKPKETQLLKMAKEKHCICITGEEAFIYQAKEQDRIWLEGGKGSGLDVGHYDHVRC